MPRKFIKFLDGSNIYVCRGCATHLSQMNDLLSTAFTARSGQAYLFNRVVNVKLGQSSMQQLRTGRHKTAPIYCNVCDNQKAIGWKYLWAEEESQKYKEDRFILERAYIEKEKSNT